MCPDLKNDFVKLKECYPTLTVNSPAFKFDIAMDRSCLPPLNKY